MIGNAQVPLKVDELDDLEAEMVRLLQRFMGSKEPFHTFTERVWRPPTDIYETADALVITIEIAGVPREALRVELNHNILMVRGHRDQSHSASQVSYHQMEIKYGSFEVELRLPSGLDYDAARARYVDGFLTITTPKREAATPKVISIDIDIESA